MKRINATTIGLILFVGFILLLVHAVLEVQQEEIENFKEEHCKEMLEVENYTWKEMHNGDEICCHNKTCVNPEIRLRGGSNE